MAPKVIFWDVGNTLIRSNTDLTIRRLARLAGKTSEEIKRAIARRDSGYPSPVELANLGRIGTRRFIRHIRWRLNFPTQQIPNRRIRTAFFGTFELPKEICYLLYFLKDKMPMGIISNTIKLAWRHIEDTFPVSRLDSKVFKFYHLSCKEGVQKPEREIYARAYLAARELIGNDLSPHDCLFFDDKPENILSAQVFGFRAIRTAHAGDAKIFETLSALGVPLPAADFSPPRYVVPSRDELEKRNRRFERVV